MKSAKMFVLSRILLVLVSTCGPVSHKPKMSVSRADEMWSGSVWICLGIELCGATALLVLQPPMAAQSLRHFREPGAIVGNLENCCRAELLHGVGHGSAEWLQEPGRHEDWNVMRLTIQHPGDLDIGQAGRWATEAGHESILFFVHP